MIVGFSRPSVWTSKFCKKSSRGWQKCNKLTYRVVPENVEDFFEATRRRKRVRRAIVRLAAVAVFSILGCQTLYRYGLWRLPNFLERLPDLVAAYELRDHVRANVRRPSCPRIFVHSWRVMNLLRNFKLFTQFWANPTLARSVRDRCTTEHIWGISCFARRPGLSRARMKTYSRCKNCHCRWLWSTCRISKAA